MPNTEKAPNYTDEQVKIMRDAAPLNYEKAQELAEQFGKKPKSIIAKAKREQIEYLAKAPEPKRPKAMTKAQIVALVSERTGLKLLGLEKAPVPTLSEIAGALNVEIPDSV